MPPRPGVRGCQYCIVSCMSCLHHYQASASAAVQKNPKMAKDAEGDKDAAKAGGERMPVLYSILHVLLASVPGKCKRCGAEESQDG